MSEQIIKVIDAICEKLGIAIDWTQENILPYVQEICGKYIRYEIATSIAWCLIFIALTAISFVCAKEFHKVAKAIKYDEDEPITYAAIISMACVVVFGLIGVFVLSFQIFDIITCLTFPEKMILEFANDLLK